MSTHDYDEVESYRVQGDMYCISSEMKDAGIKNGRTEYHNCSSSDALSVYENVDSKGDTHYTAYCYSCSQAFSKEAFHNSSHALDFGVDGGVVTEKKTFTRKPKAVPITREEMRKVLSYGYEGKGVRGLKDEYCKFFGYITKLGEDGQPKVRFYPETKDGKLMGYKSRTFPKKFGYENVGLTGINNDLSGMVKFKDFVGHRDVMLCAGEEDVVAAYQIFRDNQIRKGQEDYAPMAVVSPTTGEGSAIKQIRSNYDFLNQFQTIYLALDNDDVGKQAMLDIAEILPREKVKLVYWTHKDPNNHVILGKEKQALSDFWNATALVESGVLRSTELMAQVSEVLLAPRIPLPDYMGQLSNMAGGSGVRQYTINNIIGFTSSGKCHGKGTPILMYDGTIKEVENVVRGDKIMGADGGVRNVLSTVKGQDILYKIDQMKGMSYVVNSEHILSLRAGYTTKGKDKFTKGEVYNIKTTDYLKLSNDAKRSLKGYKGDLKLLGAGSHKVFEPYMVGFWLADGSKESTRITFAKADTELWDNFEAFIARNNYSYSIAPSFDRDTTKTPLISGGFRGVLSSNNLIKNKHIPSVYKNACYEDRIELLSGLLDGDGYKSKGTYEIVQKSKKLTEDIIFLARSLGFQVSCKKTFKKCQGFVGGYYYRMIISGDLTKLRLKLPRKQITEKSDLRRLHNTAIEVTEIGVGDYYGFELDGDHLYCLEDFTVTHNTTHVNAMVYHWIFHAPEKPCIISLEASAGQYAIDLLSLHLEKNLIRIGDGQEVVDYLHKPEVQEMWKDLWEDEYGEPRFALVDDRNSNIKSIEKTMEDCFNRDGCRIFVIDVLSDLLRGASADLQEDHMMWQRNFVKKGATIFNVLHTSKPPTTKEGKQGRITEYMALGSGTFVQSAACNILIERDKLTDDPIEKNTTRVSVPKLRGGDTGKAGEWYYDVETRKVYDRNKYFSEHPEKLPQGYDLNINPLEVAEEKKGGFGKKQETQSTQPVDSFNIDMGDGLVL